MKKSLIALAFGTLGLGIAEFTMMGILPYVATDLGISIPVAGHFISAYALGVCFGAPMLLLARKRPLKQILLVLMALMIVGNICASMAPNYWVLLLGRFVSGLPHGAYFGVASIVAGKLAPNQRWAVFLFLKNDKYGTRKKNKRNISIDINNPHTSYSRVFEVFEELLQKR